MATILDFPLLVWWKIILSSTVGWLDPENICLAVEICPYFIWGPMYNEESLFTPQVVSVGCKIKYAFLG